MFHQKSRLYTETGDDALRHRGYTLKPTAQGFSFGKIGRVNAYGIGACSTLFLNDLLSRSGLTQATPFVYDFGRTPFTPGTLLACSPSSLEAIQRKGKSYLLGDELVEELFLSDALSKKGRELATFYQVPAVAEADVVECVGGALKVKGDEEPFYYLLRLSDMTEDGNIAYGVPAHLLHMINTRKYSYSYGKEKNVLAISNTESAYNGLPPNSKALRMDLLDHYDRQQASGQTGGTGRGRKGGKPRKKDPPTTPSKKAVSREPLTWQTQLRDFLEDPSMHGWKRFIKSSVVKEAFHAAKNGEIPADKLNRHRSRRLREPMAGVAKAVSGAKFVEMLDTHFPTEIAKLVAILNWHTLTRWEQGKVFFVLTDKKAPVGETVDREAPAVPDPGDGELLVEATEPDSHSVSSDWSDEMEEVHRLRELAEEEA